MAEPARKLIWAPQPGPQKALVDCPVPEVLFGGARGGGKSDGVLGKWLLKALRYGAGFNGVLFRQTMPSADDLWNRVMDLWGRCGAKVNLANLSAEMPNGARLRLRPLERTSDADKYQGQNLSDACVEEAGLYATSDAIDRLHGALRSPHGVPTQLLLTANPGGAGQHWIKDRYIDPAPGGMKVLYRDLPNGARHPYVYIPSRVQDNRVLMHADPTYVDRLYLVGSKELVRAWLEGDWSVVAGAFFDGWSSARHVCKPFTVPAHWGRFRAADWGYASPFAVLWFAVASDDTLLPNGMTLPRGGLLCYREWYGATGPNVGLRLTAEKVAEGVKAREAGETTLGNVIDPSAFKEDGGPSIAERMMKCGTIWRAADNTRVAGRGSIGGWDLVRSRLEGEAPDRPMLVFFDTCKDIIRTLPVLQHDDTRAEDLDTGSEDHAADALRYGCASRPWIRGSKPEQKPKPLWRPIAREPDNDVNWKTA
jgi:hypothetical protein